MKKKDNRDFNYTKLPLLPSSLQMHFYPVLPLQRCLVLKKPPNCTLTTPVLDTDSFSNTNPQGNPQASHAMLATLQHQFSSCNNEVNASNPLVTLQPAARFMSGGSDGENRGVDFKNLLDNLSSSIPAVPTGSVPEITTSSAVDTLTHVQSDSFLPTAFGLPSYPQSQDISVIHGQNRSNNEITTYSKSPSQDVLSIQQALASQQSNYRSTAPPIQLEAAPNTAHGTSSDVGAPPLPPVATFQHGSAQTSIVSSEIPPPQPNPHYDNLDRILRRDHYTGDDEAPWGADIQKKYDEFLHDERVYVTEGLWDRFPPGSRLFVGKLRSRLGSPR